MDYKDLTEKILVEVSKRGVPIRRLAEAIFKAVFACADGVESHLGVHTHEQSTAVRLEFLYFFSHLVNRVCIGKLEEQEIDNIYEELGPSLIVPFVDVYYDRGN